ncbi:hypothetical protein ACFE04_006925 [Oxalis oulophora]
MGHVRRLNGIRSLYTSIIGAQESSYLLGDLRTYSTALHNVSGLQTFNGLSPLYNNINNNNNNKTHLDATFPRYGRTTNMLHSSLIPELSFFVSHKRTTMTQVRAPAQARQMGAVQVSMSSPGFIYEPYEVRERLPFWKRWFTKTGWRRIKEDVVLELKSAYAIAKLRKTGYSKDKFYKEAAQMYKEINTLIANGNKTAIRKPVTDKMHSELKNEIKQRESLLWSKIYWEMVEPIVSIRTLRARLIGVDRNDLSKVFVQLTLEFLTKQKFEAYDSKGAVVAGNKNKEILVREIWVFEKSLFHAGAYWRLCGRIPAAPKA